MPRHLYTFGWVDFFSLCRWNECHQVDLSRMGNLQLHGQNGGSLGVLHSAVGCCADLCGHRPAPLRRPTPRALRCGAGDHGRTGHGPTYHRGELWAHHGEHRNHRSAQHIQHHRRWWPQWRWRRWGRRFVFECAKCNSLHPKFCSRTAIHLHQHHHQHPNYHGLRDRNHDSDHIGHNGGVRHSHHHSGNYNDVNTGDLRFRRCGERSQGHPPQWDTWHGAKMQFFQILHPKLLYLMLIHIKS